MMTRGLRDGTFPERWIHGAPEPKACRDEAIQVHAYNSDFIILRQSKAVHFEAPFLYLLFGQTKAVLFDTGATRSEQKFPLRATVEGLLRKRYGERRKDIELIVTHTHAHGDHVAADSQFIDQPGTRVVGAKLEECLPYFGIKAWPDATATMDLGGRVLHLIPIPGHETTDLAIYDEETGIVLSGDTVYPGRLYITDWQVFRSSLARLHDYLKDRSVSHFLGSHIEMSVHPGVDYPAGTQYQPEELPLEMSWSDFVAIRDAVEAIGIVPRREAHPKFVLTPTRGGES